MLDRPEADLGGRPAGFWRRGGGALIDGIFNIVVHGIARAALGTAAGESVGILVSLGYFTYFHGRTGRTPGNALFGIRVVDLRENVGQPIGYPRAALRWLVSVVSALIVFLGYLWMLWDPRKQTWHDAAAGCVPVHLGKQLFAPPGQFS